MTAAGAAAFAVSSRTAWARTSDGDGGDVRGGSGDTDPHGRILLDAAMKWRRLPAGWQSAPFFGNGFLAAHLYSKAGEGNALRIMLNHSLVQDQRGQWEAAIGYSRLPVGYLTLTFTGTVTDVDWSLDPATAELNGTVTTTAGGVRMRMLILRQSDVLLVFLEPTMGERKAAWAFTALPSATTRTSRVPPEYTANPDPAVGPGFVEQPLDAGGGYTTAWREIHEGSRRLLAAGIAYGFPDSTGRERALSAVDRALTTAPDALVREHRRWWGDFYRRSLVSVPDKHLQRFYWIQLYKMASSTGKDSPYCPSSGRGSRRPATTGPISGGTSTPRSRIR